MSLHRKIEDWRDIPKPSGAGTVLERRGVCDCGWEGPWHATGSSDELAHRDYRQHVEAALGAGAYYEADVACRNCGSEHRQGVLVGTFVQSAVCSRCAAKMLDPNNDVWREGRRVRGFGA
jgi:hypothetical protein